MRMVDMMQVSWSFPLCISSKKPHEGGGLQTRALQKEDQGKPI